jgi:flagellar basal-body rod protein FlgB
MIQSIFPSDGEYQLARKLLDASALRQDAIAANLANSDTPGYHRVDVAPDFSEHLKASLAAGGSARSNDIQPTLAEDRNARSVRPDGNNVEIEHELLAMNRNAVEYEYLTQIVSSNIKELKMAITGNASS